jgi:fructose-1-phosphate kinase PfkB-like protein
VLVDKQLVPVVGAQPDPGAAVAVAPTFLQDQCRYDRHHVDVAGDSFASGLIYGLLEGQPLQTAVEYGAAHGALAMTTPGDPTTATKAEVLKLAAGGGARVDR